MAFNSISQPRSLTRPPRHRCDHPTHQDAEQIESLLPKTQSREFVEQREFNTRLRAVTPHTFTTWALMAMNVLVFAAMAIDGAGVLKVNSEVHLRWGANFGPLTNQGQWWRLLTSTFLHFGFLHLLFNMLALYSAGPVVERLYGNMRFLILYLIAGVAGSMTSVMSNPTVVSAGASGAIFGVLGGMIAYSLVERKSVPVGVAKQLRKPTLVFIAYNLLQGFTHAGIDNAAHLGGLVVGAVAGLLLARPLETRKVLRSPSIIAPNHHVPLGSVLK